MDFSRTENNKVTIKHFEWLGFKNVNGALVKDGLDGEIQFYDGNFWYSKDNVAVKKIVTEKDINDIYLSQVQEPKIKGGIK
jgi:hypothetical protein